MKKGILLLLLISSLFADAQSLKEALYSGKLKNEPGTVIRRGDDLSSKMDTATRKPATDETAKANTAQPVVDSLAKKQPATTESAAVASTTTEKQENTPAATDTAATGEAAKAPDDTAAAPKDNNALWKAYMSGIIGTLKTEVLSSKKVKSGSYYVLLSYAIGTDGQVTVNDVFVSPENEFLQKQIKDRLALETLRLNPVLSDSGTPRKVNKKYNFTITKE